MPIVYIIQVMAHHGYGLEGWRTVRKTSREPYCFETYEMAHAAMCEHFGNLREGINVRIHTMDATDAIIPLSVEPLPSCSSSASLSARRSARPSQ